jgi:DNA-binding phage protein
METRRKGRIISSHPKLTPAKLAEIQAVREKIDREEKDQIIAHAKEMFAQHERKMRLIGALKAARVERSLTLEQVGQKSGIGVSDLSELETSPNPNPTIDTLLRIAGAVGVEVLATNAP